MAYIGWYGVDLDGTLAEHYWPHDGPYDHYRIGQPVPAMVERVKQWRKEGRDVRIFTARITVADEPKEVGRIVEAIKAWCRHHLGEELPITNVKDYMMEELWDDRAVRVMMNTGLPCCFNHHGA